MTKFNMKMLATVLAATSLAGCSPDVIDETSKVNDKAIDALLDVQNIDPADIAYGDRTPEPGPARFNAEFDALVFFGLDTNGQFVSTVRYFTAAGNTYDSIKGQMLACIAILDGDMGKDCDNQLKKVTLDNLTFRAPTNVVFVARNPTLKFGPEPLVFSKSLDRIHADYPDGKKAKPNKSFYNAAVAEEAGRQLVYVRNYYSKENGQPIVKGDKYWYGLNIFMTIDQVGGNPVKIIVDPDTGNMGGNP